jgi:hypothetical protein
MNICAYRAWTIYNCAWPTRRPRQILTFLYIQKDKIENITIPGYIESKDILKILYTTLGTAQVLRNQVKGGGCQPIMTSDYSGEGKGGVGQR